LGSQKGFLNRALKECSISRKGLITVESSRPIPNLLAKPAGKKFGGFKIIGFVQEWFSQREGPNLYSGKFGG